LSSIATCSSTVGSSCGRGTLGILNWCEMARPTCGTWNDAMSTKHGFPFCCARTTRVANDLPSRTESTT